MTSSLMQFFRRALGREPGLHPIDRGMARHWVKRRLSALYPHLRDDPDSLDEAYRAITLEPRLGSKDGDDAAYFQMILPGSDKE